jgi:uncharacterized repeat protein (TIGR01451 family)
MPGAGSSVSTGATIVSLSINGTNVVVPSSDADGDGVPGDGTPITVGPVTVTFDEAGVRQAGPGFADIVVKPVTITVGLPQAPTIKVILGLTEAHATTPASSGSSLVVTKSVDENFDPANTNTASLVPDGGPGSTTTVAPHQKMWFVFCVGNDGSTPLTNVALTDVVDPRLRVVLEPPGPPTDFALNGATLTSKTSVLPATLQPGDSRLLKVLVEVRQTTAPNGQLISNTGTATATETGQRSSSLNLRISLDDPTQPALFSRATSFACNKVTREYTVGFELLNQGIATANNVVVDQAVATGGVVIKPGELPRAIGTVLPGAANARPFSLTFIVPGPPGSSCAGFTYTLRETGRSSTDDRIYTFD